MEVPAELPNRIIIYDISIEIPSIGTTTQDEQTTLWIRTSGEIGTGRRA